PDLAAGTHNVVVAMDGYEDFQQSVTIEGGQTSNVAGTLSSPRAELNVVTKPPGIEVLIDGKSYGPSPVRATLAPGNHTYTVKPPGAAPYENTVALKSGGIVTKTLTLAGAATTGIVEVRTIPPGATVQADGSFEGGQTPTSFRLSVGTHTLIISLSGYPPVRQQVTVSESEPAKVNVTLTGR
ncbi:MAG: PEGA domain-containing protein, partial [Terriglobia bacterium]